MCNNESLLDKELSKLQHSLKFDSAQYFPIYLSEIYSELQQRVQPIISTNTNNKQLYQQGLTFRVFMNYFNIQSFIGEKIFNLFDNDNDGLLSKNEFIKGFTTLYQGDFKEVSELVFAIFDFNKDERIIRKDVELLLSYIPTKADNANDQMRMIDETIKEYTTYFIDDSYKLNNYFKLIEQNHCNHLIKLLGYLYDMMPFTLEEVNYCKHKKKKTIMKALVCKKSMMPGIIRSPEKKSAAFNFSNNENFTIKKVKHNNNEKDEEPNTPKIGHTKKASCFAFTSNLIPFASLEQDKDKSRSPVKTRAKSKMLTTAFTKFDISSPKVSSNENSLQSTKKHQSSEERNKCVINTQIKCFSPKTLPESNNDLNDFIICNNEEKQLEDWVYKYDENIKINTFKKYYVVLVNKSLIFFSNATKTELLLILNLNSTFIKSNDATQINKVNYYPITINYNITKYNEKVLYFIMESTRSNWLQRIKVAIRNNDITDSFTFLKVLGAGRFGVVQLASKLNRKEHVAVKIINKLKLKEKDYELIMNELSIMKLIMHPSLVQLYDHFESDTNIYLVMEVLEGGDLISFINEKEGQLTEKEAAKLMKIIGSGIQYFTKFGLIHRDLKPENIILGKKGDVNSVKIIDFSLTKTLTHGETLSDSMGTINYVAPELLKKKPYDHKADVWSLGVILYFLLGGILPFDDEHFNEAIIGKKIVYSDQEYPKKYFGNRSNSCIMLIDKCLQKSPDKRITINDFMEDNWIRSYGN